MQMASCILGNLLDGACAWDSKNDLAQSGDHPQPVVLTCVMLSSCSPLHIPHCPSHGQQSKHVETEPTAPTDSGLIEGGHKQQHFG